MNRIYYKAIFTLLLVSFFGNLAAAQETLSLPDVVAYTLENNSEIKKSLIQEKIGFEVTKEVRSTALPQVMASGNYTNNLLLPVLVVPGELTGNPGEVSTLEVGLDYTNSIALSLNQPLFDKSVFTALKAARSSEELYALRVKKTKEEVVYRAVILYYNVSILERNIDILQSNLDQTNKLLEISAVQLDQGFIKQVDHDRLKVSKMNLEVQLSDLNLTRKNTIKQLQLIMGMDQETILILEYDEDKEVQLVDVPPMTHENLTDLNLLNVQKRLYELEKINFQSGYFPKLSFFANYAYNGISNDALFSGSDVTTNWYDVSSIGLSLKLSLFDGFRRSAQSMQSQLKKEQVEESIEFTREKYSVDYANAQNKLNQSLSTLETRKTSVDLAQKVYDLSQKSYEEGLSDLTDLLSAETALTTSQLNYSAALLQVKISEIEILKSTGKLLESY
ncbi:TolC family protein [Ekhidna sp.]|jgi:outer membrane protein|uniref:TolC family protein n=1 Tax=Ekhidna sp. TaxID=2608089 RepID=UPI0032EE721F